MIATGARTVDAVSKARSPSATAPGARPSAASFDELEADAGERLVFAVPLAAHWSLPAYELALLTAAHLRARGVPASRSRSRHMSRGLWSCSARPRRRSSASS